MKIFGKNWQKFEPKFFKNLRLRARKNEKFWKIFLKMSIFWKWFFANISRTVRARAKILVKINPLGHKRTPPHLFPAKNVILLKVWHGSKIWSFCNEKNSKNVGFCRKKIDQISCFCPDVILSSKTPLYSHQILKFWGKI